MSSPVNVTTEVSWEKYPGVVDLGFLAGWGLAAPLDVFGDLPWLESSPLGISLLCSWQDSTVLDVSGVLPWGGALAMDPEIALPWRPAFPTDPEKVMHWLKTMAADPEKVLPWQKTTGADSAVSVAWAVVAMAEVETRLAWDFAAKQDTLTVCPWERPVPLDVSSFTPFEREYIKQALRRVYHIPWLSVSRLLMSKQEIVFRRVSDGAPVRLVDVSAYIDEGSWAWSFSGTLPSMADADLIRPGAVLGERETEVYLEINGYAWSFLVNSAVKNVAWAKGTYGFSGRSKSVIFGDDYCPKITASFPATPAQTVVGDLLSGSGWSWSWRLLENTWNLMAGDLVASGETKIDILRRVAAAVGGVLQSDPENNTLIFQSRFPVSPENWVTETPDVYITSGIMTQKSEAQPRPGYNQVVISGQRSGVIGTVRRSGTAGDVPALAIIDPLLTNTAVITERGRVELAEKGHDYIKESLVIALPGVGSSPPLLSIGQLVHVADPAGAWVGKVCGVSVAASAAKTRQSVTILRLAE